MKKKVQTMKLNRETLRSLDGEGLKGVDAGLSQLNCSQASYCYACLTLAASFCPKCG